MSDTPGNPELLRREIKTVETDGEIATNSEVAASTLGTDAEASGNPPTKAEVQQARGLEARSGVNNSDPARTRSVTANPYGMPILMAVAAAVVLGAVLWWLLSL